METPTFAIGIHNIENKRLDFYGLDGLNEEK